MPFSSLGRRTLKTRLSLPLFDDEITKLLAHLGSDDDVDPSDTSDDKSGNFIRRKIIRLRQKMIESEEDKLVDESVNYEPMVLESMNEDMNEDMNVRVNGPEPNVSTVFQWIDEFTNFTGQRETYRRDSGPTFTSQVEIFLKIWDEDMMGLIAKETHKYAREHIEQYTDPEIGATIPKYF